MSRIYSSRGEYAVSEVVGGMILLVIALVAFSVIYLDMTSKDYDVYRKNVNIVGSVNDDGTIYLEHLGGDVLNSYEISVFYGNGSFIGKKNYNDEWSISKCINPLVDYPELSIEDEDDSFMIVVFATNEDGDKQQVFDGVLCGKPERNSTYDSMEDPMLISSLKSNTADEDLICYNYTITPSIDAWSYVYNWTLNGNPIVKILFPFDNTNFVSIRDYSGNAHEGLLNGPIWSAGGKIGGTYLYDGVDDFIDIPFCFDGSFIDEVTVEAWIKTSSSDVAVASYDQEKYWELNIRNGVVQWITTDLSDTYILTGSIRVDDGVYHHIAVTYDSSSGECAIYVDGELDVMELGHGPGSLLGIGSPISGYIGRGMGSAEEEIIFSTGFETQVEEDAWSKDTSRSTAYWWENYNFERLANDSISSHSGTYSLVGTGDFDPRFVAYNRDGIDISGYSDVKVGIWYSYKSTEGDDDFGFYYQNGSSWVPIFEDFNPDIGEGNQLDWTYAESNIPESINNLVLEFYWSSSSAREYMAIDDLLITGISDSGCIGNFSGYIDEFHVYDHCLSGEQIHQNYLCSKDGDTSCSVIVSEETSVGQVWSCTVIPTDGFVDDDWVTSNSIQIISYSGGG